MTLWCHGWGCTPFLTASHIHIRYIQSDWAPSYAVDGHMNAPLHCYTCVSGDKILKIGVKQSPNVLWCHGLGCKPPLTASHIHIGCVYSDWAPSYTVDGHMGALLHRYTCAGGGQILENCGKVKPKWGYGVMVDTVNHYWLHPKSILDV